jgi:uncharacterized protein YcbK (DUF882 family)
MTIGCDSSTPLTSRFDTQVLKPNSNIFDTLFDPTSLMNQSNPLDRVDRQTVVDLTNALNIFLGSADLGPYPTLENRFNQFPITYVDTADFILANQTNTATLYPVIRNYNPGIAMPVILSSFLSDFDFHLDTNMGNTIAGGLCGQFGNIFQKLLGLFTLIETAKGLIEDIKNLAELDPLKKLKSMTLRQILVALKRAIIKIVKKLVKQVRKQIAAMLTSVIDTITDIGLAAERLYKKLKKMADDIIEFFEDPSIEKFVENIEKFISSTASQFERLTVENVALLMFRFCQFTELLQSLLMGPAKALTALAQTIAVESLIAKNSSLKQTQAAVEAGATRVPVAQRISIKEEAIENNNTAPSAVAENAVTPLEAVTLAAVAASNVVGVPLTAAQLGKQTSTGVSIIEYDLPAVPGTPTATVTVTPSSPVVIDSTKPAVVPPPTVAVTIVPAAPAATKTTPAAPAATTAVATATTKAAEVASPSRKSLSVVPPEKDWMTPKEATAKELALVSKLTAAGIPGKFTFAPLVISNNGWQKVQPIVWVKLLRICELTGRSFVVTSGYRNKGYNAKVGGVTDSLHMSGYAVDVAVSVAIRDDVFLAAQRAGFTGIGIYSVFMHLDCGPRRMWVSGAKGGRTNTYPLGGADLSKWVAAIPRHNADLYRKNSGISAEQLAQQQSNEKKVLAQIEAARRTNGR